MPKKKPTFAANKCLIFNFISMKRGSVKFFNESKGYGFIKVEGSEEEIFVHVTGIVDQIYEGDVVTFEVIEGRKGLNAVNVRLAE